jgi:hypothetical protein
VDENSVKVASCCLHLRQRWGNFYIRPPGSSNTWDRSTPATWNHGWPEIGPGCPGFTMNFHCSWGPKMFQVMF